MAAGDYVVRLNNANTDTIPNAGSSLKLAWNSAVANVGSGITYAGGTFTLGETGKFLVLASDQEGTTSTTNNERINTKMTFRLGGTELLEGYSTGYIRKAGGSQEFIHFSAAIVDVTSTTGTADELDVYKERIDNTTAGGEEPSRITDRSGIIILKLDDSWNYGLYRGSAFATSTTDNVATTADLSTTDEQDGTVFSRTSNTVAVNTSNLVLGIYSLKSEDATPSGRAEYQGRITRGGTVYDMSYSQTYLRVTDNCDWAGMSACFMWEGTGSSENVEVEVVSRDTGGDEFQATLQLIELPSAAEAIIVSDGVAGGDINASATNWVWDNAADYIDTAAFTFSAGQANLDVDNADDYIVMAGFGRESLANATRAVPALGFRVNTTDNEQAGNSSYCRNSGTSEWPALNTATMLTGLSASDSIYARHDRIGTVSTAISGVGGMGVIRYSSLFGDTVDDLLADDVESASEVTAPSIGQTHAITADDVESASEVTAPSVGQTHALTATSVESASEVTAPALSESHILLADDIESASEVTAPSLGQVHGLTATSVESASEVTAPSVGQEHALTATSVESASEVTAPTLAESSSVDNLLAEDVESASEVTAPTLTQVHVLTSVSVESASELSAPNATGDIPFGPSNTGGVLNLPEDHPKLRRIPRYY